MVTEDQQINTHNSVEMCGDTFYGRHVALSPVVVRLKDINMILGDVIR